MICTAFLIKEEDGCVVYMRENTNNWSDFLGFWKHKKYVYCSSQQIMYPDYEIS